MHDLFGDCRIMTRRVKMRLRGSLDDGRKYRIGPNPTIDRWIADHCRAGNRALDARHGGRLSSHGYAL
jgi:hypothetical protein